MIVLPEGHLTPVARHGLQVLIDLSRLLPAPAGLGAVGIELTDEGDGSLRDLGAPFRVVDGRVRIPRPLLTNIGEIVSAKAEQVSTARDRLGRVPTGANALVLQGLDGTPVISFLAAQLRQAVAERADARPYRTLAPWPNGKRWAASLTHDLDVVALWPFFTALRVVELAGKGEWGQVARSLAAAAKSAFGDPVLDCVRGILEVERRAGVKSSWYIICGSPTLESFRGGDITYTPESSATARILAAIAESGHETGLHGSRVTAEHAEEFIGQVERLRRIAPKTGAGVRQHFLRMTPGVTQEGMRRAGFQYDATWGFPDRNGFRLGVADVVAWEQGTFDLVPFCWMDRTQSKYQGIEDPKAWTAAALESARKCREVEGMWNGIWHPNLTAALGYPRAPEAYQELVTGLVADPTLWCAPVEEIVAWRRRRRGARAVGIADGGVVRAETPIRGASLRLEDAAGVLREEVTS
jgi:hypothetical protein